MRRAAQDAGEFGKFFRLGQSKMRAWKQQEAAVLAEREARRPKPPPPPREPTLAELITMGALKHKKQLESEEQQLTMLREASRSRLEKLAGATGVRIGTPAMLPPLR